MIFVQMLEIVALSDLASLLCARKFLFAPQGSVPQIALFGLSALAEGPMDSRSFVRPSVRPFVRHTPYLEKRASDFDDFLHKATS